MSETRSYRPGPRPAARLAFIAVLAIAVLNLSAGIAGGEAKAAKPEAGGQNVPDKASKDGKAESGKSGLPLPRYASLRANEVNVRTGPGVRYPVKWVFVRRNLPIEIIAEFSTWRKIRDWQGTEGWVHRSMLSGKRTVIITNEVQVMRREPSRWAPPVARVEAGVVAHIIECGVEWCRVEAGGFSGWVKNGQFWGRGKREQLQ